MIAQLHGKLQGGGRGVARREAAATPKLLDIKLLDNDVRARPAVCKAPTQSIKQSTTQARPSPSSLAPIGHPPAASVQHQSPSLLLWRRLRVRSLLPDITLRRERAQPAQAFRHAHPVSALSSFCAASRETVGQCDRQQLGSLQWRREARTGKRHGGACVRTGRKHSPAETFCMPSSYHTLRTTPPTTRWGPQAARRGQDHQHQLPRAQPVHAADRQALFRHRLRQHGAGRAGRGCGLARDRGGGGGGGRGIAGRAPAGAQPGPKHLKHQGLV